MSDELRKKDIELARLLGYVPCDKWRLQTIGLSGPEWLKGTEECEHERCLPEEWAPSYHTQIGAAFDALEATDFDWEIGRIFWLQDGRGSVEYEVYVQDVCRKTNERSKLAATICTALSAALETKHA